MSERIRAKKSIATASSSDNKGKETTTMKRQREQIRKEREGREMKKGREKEKRETQKEERNIHNSPHQGIGVKDLYKDFYSNYVMFRQFVFKTGHTWSIIGQRWSLTTPRHFWHVFLEKSCCTNNIDFL